MKVFELKDHTGAESTHLAKDLKAAIQAHLLHHGLLHLDGEIEVMSTRTLREVENRNSICWNLQCCMAGAFSYKEYDIEVSPQKVSVNAVKKKENNHGR